MSLALHRSAFWFPLLAALAAGPAQAQNPFRIPLRPADLQDAAPAVESRDFAATNAAHKVVVAIWGTGLDYNQPLLFDNVHFDLSSPTSVGVGWDFLRNQNLATYHIIDTGEYPYEMLPQEERDKVSSVISPAEYNAKAIESSAEQACVYSVLAQADPRVSRYMGARRKTGFEYRELGETTQVAGLVTGGLSDVGVIPYRVRPYTKTDAEVLREASGKGAVEMDQLKRVLDDLSRPQYEGKVKIVFLSTADFIVRPDVVKSAADNRNYEAVALKVKTLAKGYQDAMRAHPEILFITYPDSSGEGWTDNRSLVQFPCGLAADNLLCVGFLNERGDISPSQRVPVNQAPEHPTHPNQGTHILFTRPQTELTTKIFDNCHELMSLSGDLSEEGSAVGQSCKKEEKDGKQTGAWVASAKLTSNQMLLLEENLGKCEAADHLTTGMGELRPTIRAASEVTRVAARYWADHPEIKTGAEIVRTLMGQSKCTPMGSFGQGCFLDVPAINWQPAIDKWSAAHTAAAAK